MTNKISNRVVILLALGIIVSMIIFKAAYASSPPVVDTGQAQPQDTSVTITGTVQDSGGKEISQYGFKWGTSPDLENMKTEIAQSIGGKQFQVTIKNLEEGATYYYQAFAINAKGSDQGDIKSFTVPVNNPPTVTISSPADQITVTRGEVVNIAAAAADDKKVISMSLQVDGAVKSEVQDEKLNYRWETDSVKPGKYQIKVTASDGNKNSEKLVDLIVKAEPPKAVAAITPAATKPVASTQPTAPADSTSRGSKPSYTPAYNSMYPKLSKVNGSFGQFRYRDTSGGRIEIDPQWVKANIVTVTLPGINRKVQVHKDAAGAFIKAFTYIQNGTATINGKTVPLTSLVKTMDGTFVPRHVGWSASRSLSNHSWGTAIDINAGDHYRYVNPAKEPNDPNYILWEKAFKPAGFSWGNSYSDAMHYELLW